MRDYQKGVTLRDIGGAVVQHSDTSCSNSKSQCQARSRSQLRGSSCSLPLFETRPGGGWGRRAAPPVPEVPLTETSSGNGRDRAPPVGSLVATRTLCCMSLVGLYKLLFFRLQRQNAIKEPGPFWERKAFEIQKCIFISCFSVLLVGSNIVIL